MATYAIGDIQGCYNELKALLSHIEFNSDNDKLWFTGDLVNRGPDSLQVLRFIKSLGDKAIVVLGNHDLHLLGLSCGVRQYHVTDTLDDVLKAIDRNDLIDWLRTRPLIHSDNTLGYTLVHAGLAPMWNLTTASILAKEVEAVLMSDNYNTHLKDIFGNSPDKWDDHLQGIDRTRCIINYFTRIRFCYADGRLDFQYKGTIENKPPNLFPWFSVPNRLNKDTKIIFGHWAALGLINVSNVYSLDTGCVWGNKLTAFRLEDQHIFSIHCPVRIH